MLLTLLSQQTTNINSSLFSTLDSVTLNSNLVVVSEIISDLTVGLEDLTLNSIADISIDNVVESYLDSTTLSSNTTLDIISTSDIILGSVSVFSETELKITTSLSKTLDSTICISTTNVDLGIDCVFYKTLDNTSLNSTLNVIKIKNNPIKVNYSFVKKPIKIQIDLGRKLIY